MVFFIIQEYLFLKTKTRIFIVQNIQSINKAYSMEYQLC